MQDLKQKVLEYLQTKGYHEYQLKELNPIIQATIEATRQALSLGAVSVVHEPVASGAVCPHFNACQNGGKNEYCDLQTFNEIDCFVGQTER